MFPLITISGDRCGKCRKKQRKINEKKYCRADYGESNDQR